MSLVAIDGAPGSVAPDIVDRAVFEADQAARAAGLRVRAGDTVAELRELVVVGDAVWGPHGTYAVNEMRALALAGGVVLGAYDTADEDRGPVGFLVGFLGWNGGLHLHSHQTGVLPDHRGRGVGYALKLTQRAMCLAHGVQEVRWTFDPLVRRNTSFNLRRLGARAARFLPDFYGRMDDALNGDDLTDRVEAVWRLTEPIPAAPEGAPVLTQAARGAVLVDQDGWPRLTTLPLQPGSHIAVPAEFGLLRQGQPRLARAWRLAVRQVLEQAYSASLRIGDVDNEGYLLEEVEDRV